MALEGLGLQIGKKSKNLATAHSTRVSVFGAVEARLEDE